MVNRVHSFEYRIYVKKPLKRQKDLKRFYSHKQLIKFCLVRNKLYLDSAKVPASITACLEAQLAGNC